MDALETNLALVSIATGEPMTTLLAGPRSLLDARLRALEARTPHDPKAKKTTKKRAATAIERERMERLKAAAIRTNDGTTGAAVEAL